MTAPVASPGTPPARGETALIVCAAPSEGGARLLEDLAHTHGRVIAVDGGADLCARAGVLPHVVIGDMDSVTPSVLSAFIERGVEVRRFPAEKDQSDLDLALDLARGMNVARVTVTCVFGGRVDHTLAAVGSLLAETPFSIDVVDADVVGWVLAKGGRDAVALRGVGSRVSAFAVRPATLSLAGMRYPLVRAELKPLSSLGLSNTICDETATAAVQSGRILLLATPGTEGVDRAP